MISDITTIAVTIPLLLIVVKYISPYIIRLKDESRTIISLFFLLPLTYYILEYAFTVYTDLLYTGKAVIIEFMDSFIVILYFTLSIVTLHLSNKKNTAERKNIILSAAATQAEKEISQLTDYQKQAAIYRHDLRHHMTFIQNCLSITIQNRLWTISMKSTPVLIIHGLHATAITKLLTLYYHHI